MSADPHLEATINRLIAGNVLLWKVLGAASAVSGLGIGLVVIFAPFKKGELPIVIGFALFALLLEFLAFWAVYWAQRQGRRLRHLVLDHPEQIRSMKVVRAASKGIVMYGLHLLDAQGRLVGVKIPDEATGQDLMRRLIARGAPAGN